MGLFGFFKKKEEIIELEEKDFHSYFEKGVNARYSKLNAKIHEISVETKYNIRKVKESLHELEKAELHNPNVLPKEYHIMQGNRTTYIKRMTQFIEDINIPESYFEINNACLSFFDKLDNVTKDTQKNFFVLREFFANTISKINIKIKEVETLYIKLKEMLDKENIDIITEINDLFKKLEDSKSDLITFKEDTSSIRAEIKILNQELEKINKKTKSLEQSNDYRFYKQFIKEKEEFAQRETEIKRLIVEIFAEFERGFKKYSKGTTGTSITKYLKNPVEGLLSDTKLTIMTTLKKLKKEVESGKIDLKPKQKDKLISAIDSTTKESLKEFQDSLNKVSQDKEENTEKIRRNTTSLQIREQNGYKEKTLKDIKDQEDKLAIFESKLEGTNPNLILQEIPKKIGELTKRQIKWKR